MDRTLATRLPGLFMAAALAAACPPGIVEFEEGGPDAGEDGGVQTIEDSGSPDAGLDAGVPDGGAPDSGASDAGRPDGGPDGGADGGADAGPQPVDATTLTNKLLFGYQGWFLCPGDGAPPNRWVHWFGGTGNPTFDMYPDTSELGAGEKCPTSYTKPDGGPAPVYSAWRQPTVVRHFEWMKQYGLDGVMLQRFNSELGDPAFFAFRNQVLQNVRAGAEQHGRVFAVMYDVSGANASTLVADLKNDWAYLVDTLQVTGSPRYQKHKGRPVLAIWGFGFADRPASAAQAAELITWFKTGAPANQRVTLMGGVPRDWRTDAAWAPTLRGFDVVSPWTVGAFVDDPGADNYKARMIGDLADANTRGYEFMPVIFPGFSWKNLNAGPLNQIPRRGGRFWWRQLYNAKSAGATMVYGAMFDEVDEGTAMFKLAPTAADQPAQGTFLPLDADGEALPADWYLKLAGAGGKMLRGELPLSATRPITP